MPSRMKYIEYNGFSQSNVLNNTRKCAITWQYDRNWWK